MTVNQNVVTRKLAAIVIGATQGSRSRITGHGEFTEGAAPSSAAQ